MGPAISISSTSATGDKRVLAQPTFTGAPEQLWRIDQLTDGTYRIMPKQPLDARGPGPWSRSAPARRCSPGSIGRRQRALDVQKAVIRLAQRRAGWRAYFTGVFWLAMATQWPSRFSKMSVQL